VNGISAKPGFSVVQLLSAWKSILGGSTPMLSIEVTRECPLSCPGCYAYGENHLGGAATLRSLSDYRGDDLVSGIIGLVEQHRPLHVSLVGGEPLVRHRELSRVLPMLSARNIYTMVVTSAVVAIPHEWMNIPRLRVAVSVDGLPEHHDVRRKPATYDRILKNMAGREVNIHWTITRPMLQRAGYIEEYLSFWGARPEVAHIWTSTYTPQKGEQSAEILSAADRAFVAQELFAAGTRHPKLLMSPGMARALVSPPSKPRDCMFARMSTNYSADLKSRVEPCVFGGNPDCTQCGCAISSGLHAVKQLRLGGLVRVEDIALSSSAIGTFVGKLRGRKHPRWKPERTAELVELSKPESSARKAS
jgi:organic radical activating enzyme